MTVKSPGMDAKSHRVEVLRMAKIQGNCLKSVEEYRGQSSNSGIEVKNLTSLIFTAGPSCELPRSLRSLSCSLCLKNNLAEVQ